jgi:DHA2 family multidrug resistance protein
LPGIVGTNAWTSLGGLFDRQPTFLTDFFVNIPIELLHVFILLEIHYYKRNVVGKIDYLGIFFLIVGIGALQLVLEEGQQDWLNNFIVSMLIASDL